jgi:hypothetical protein
MSTASLNGGTKIVSGGNALYLKTDGLSLSHLHLELYDEYCFAWDGSFTGETSLGFFSIVTNIGISFVIYHQMEKILLF